MNIDTTKPHIGRIYDYVLGGHHNYEIDRQHAEQILKFLPAYPVWARLNRWFLQLVASRWAEQGITRVLDIASGLPTQGHLNEYLPDARILFSDNDPLSVTYGQEILKDKPNMSYMLVDVREPGPLLDAATQFFGDDRRVAVGLIGISYLLRDEQLSALAQRLYDWCAPGSVMALSFAMPYESDELALSQSAVDVFKKIGIELHFRSPKQLSEAITPWRITESDTLERLLDVRHMVSDRERTMEDFVTGAIAMSGATAER